MKEHGLCVGCNSQFVVVDQEKSFYKRYHLPDPQLCPLCRKKLRDRYTLTPFYTETVCSSCGIEILIPYNTSDHEFKHSFLCPKCASSKKSEVYSMEYSQGHFLEQYKEMLSRKYLKGYVYDEDTDVSELSHRSIDISYSKYSVESFDLSKCLNTINSQHCISTTDCVDVTFTSGGSGTCLELLNCHNCTHCAYLYNCYSCSEVYYSTDLMNCDHCFGCSGLRSKSYYIFNQEVSKEKYTEEVSMLLQMDELSLKELVDSKLKDIPTPRIFMLGDISDSYYCNNIIDCERVYYAFETSRAKNCGYLWHTESIEDSWDLSYSRKVTDSYMCADCTYSSNIFFGIDIFECANCLYCVSCVKCTDCIGCVGLMEHQYCIFNKQYEKEEYMRLKDKIVADEGIFI